MRATYGGLALKRTFEQSFHTQDDVLKVEYQLVEWHAAGKVDLTVEVLVDTIHKRSLLPPPVVLTTPVVTAPMPRRTATVRQLEVVETIINREVNGCKYGPKL